jgi:hypothetical protein
MPVDKDPLTSPQKTPERSGGSVPSPELILEASEDLGVRAVGETVSQPIPENAQIFSRQERTALRTAEPTLAEVMSRPVEAVPRPEKGDKVLAIFDGKVVEAVVDGSVSPDGAAAHEQVFTVWRTNENGDEVKKTMPVALFKPEIQADLARRQGQESLEEAKALTIPNEALAEAMGSHNSTDEYGHLFDPNYKGGSVEEAAVPVEMDEGERLARERAGRDHLANVVNNIDYQRRGF